MATTGAAAAAAVVGAPAVVKGKWNTTCKTFALLSVLPVSHSSLSLPATLPVSRVSHTALVVARHFSTASRRL